MSFSRIIHDTVFRLLWRVAVAGLLCVVVLCVVTWHVYYTPYTAPGLVSIDTYIEIPQGSSARAAAQALEEGGVIRSAQVFLAALQASGLDGAVTSGTYYFNQPQKLYEVVERVTSSDYGLPSQTVTLFEGEPVFKYASRLAAQFEYINEEEFKRLAVPYEGYLFPDTYTVAQRVTSGEIIEKMRDNFTRRTQKLQHEIDRSAYTLDEIVTMASLVETEAGNASYETKQRVAGVLWRRYEIGMLIQADAVFSYIYQEHLPRVLYRHLEVDSPYNLYKHTGLPPGPIGNPGLDSIRATLDPYNPEAYLYYLTGHDGKFYYAKTLAGHERNRRNYLQY